jgi:hypothetical protein
MITHHKSSHTSHEIPIKNPNIIEHIFSTTPTKLSPSLNSPAVFSLSLNHFATRRNSDKSWWFRSYPIADILLFCRVSSTALRINTHSHHKPTQHTAGRIINRQNYLPTLLLAELPTGRLFVLLQSQVEWTAILWYRAEVLDLFQT